MRIAKTDSIADLPATAARDFLRRVKNADFDEDWALTLLGASGEDHAVIVLGLLEAQGYIERTGASHEGSPWWRTTILGNALAMASFGKPISRKTGERLVKEMLERARLYNSDLTRPYYVQRLRIFGSYLDKTIDPLGDVDVELVIGHRVTDPQALLQYAVDSGRTFPTFMDQLMWPQKEIVQILRNRSAAINITLEDIELITDRVETFYEAGSTSSGPSPRSGSTG
ncbi:hypothetical protein [Arthrobacter cryoconiti]|uniref:Polymerase nucleotidyl transferase domain-containing protein n=1 Tax=Arthrobacter cryoconiti TaxID=748907 RepID=A0ABV8R428_9MICC|nr:hypothetical protein [Arthrobacter cryoconiti]MCC9069368.1 hypothetical protein [Arthrobacter cryoconiti]